MDDDSEIMLDEWLAPGQRLTSMQVQLALLIFGGLRNAQITYDMAGEMLAFVGVEAAVIGG